jgi:hypothetical protein
MLCFEDIEKWPLKSRLVDFGQFSVKTDTISPNLHLEAQKKFIQGITAGILAHYLWIKYLSN